MIIARSPLRLSLGGGGTDLPSYYEGHEGFLIAGAINQYVYAAVNETFDPGIKLKYASHENIETVDAIQHPLIRAALQDLSERRPELFQPPRLEITTMADIPSGTGLGSSGSFGTAMLAALYAHYRKLLLPHELAELACHLEINVLQEPVGKQDQFISAYGGLTCFTFKKNGQVIADPLRLSESARYDLEENLLMFFTGYTRSASTILSDQKKRSQAHDQEMLDNLHYIKDIGYRSKTALESGNLHQFGELMHEHWLHKRQRSQGMSNPEINAWYDLAMANGAVGGKLVGAGGGGFLLFYAEDRQKLRSALAQSGLRERRFHFVHEGTRVVAQ